MDVCERERERERESASTFIRLSRSCKEIDKDCDDAKDLVKQSQNGV